VEEDALNLMVEMCGGNLTILRQEVEKLIAYADGSRITVEMVRSICLPWESYNLFDFIDAFLSGDLKKSLRALEDSYRRGISALQLQSVLINYTLRLYTVHRLLKRGVSLEKALEAVGARHSFLKAKLKEYANRVSPQRLRELLTALHRLDTLQKTHFLNPEASLRNFTAEFLRTA